MADAIHQFKAEDEVLKDVGEIDWTEDPVEEETNSVFDVDELECVDEYDDLNNAKKGGEKNDSHCLGKTESKRTSNRHQPYQKKKGKNDGSKSRNSPMKPKADPVRRKPEVVQKAEILTPFNFDELELIDSCDADEDDASIPTTSEGKMTTSKLVSKEITCDSDQAPVSEYDEQSVADADDYEEDFPSLDEEIDVEAMMRAAELPAHIEMGSVDEKEENGSVSNASVASSSSDNPESAGRNGTERATNEKQSTDQRHGSSHKNSRDRHRVVGDAQPRNHPSAKGKSLNERDKGSGVPSPCSIKSPNQSRKDKNRRKRDNKRRRSMLTEVTKRGDIPRGVARFSASTHVNHGNSHNKNNSYAERGNGRRISNAYGNGGNSQFERARSNADVFSRNKARSSPLRNSHFPSQAKSGHYSDLIVKLDSKRGDRIVVSTPEHIIPPSVSANRRVRRIRGMAS